MNRTLKIVLPLGIVAIAAALATVMILARPEPESRIPATVVPLVRAQTVSLDDVRFSVHSQGTVNPRTESVLVPEVSGRVVEVSPRFAPGEFFAAGEMLLRVDPHDYRQALVQARAQVTQAELRVAREEAEADVARREWEDLGEGEATPLTLHEPQLADARAALDAARAQVQQAQRNLEHTEIRAPYAGRVRGKQVDRGQFVSRGSPLATIYAVDFAEVRLPLPDDDLAYVDLPLGYRGEGTSSSGPEVRVRARFAGRLHEWEGRIVRTEGEIDPRTRMVHAVARIRDPYGRGTDRDRPPLAAGLFVEAEILGHHAENVAVLPRAVLRDGDQVLVIDAEERLRHRDVEVLRTTAQEIVVSSGLVGGERVCLSALSVVTEGMQVRVVPDSGAESPR